VKFADESACLMAYNVRNNVVNNSQITGGVENAFLSTCRYFSRLIVSLKTQVQQLFLNLQHTRVQLSLDNISNCVAVLAIDLDTPVS
jgi:hypothetical protein